MKFIVFQNFYKIPQQKATTCVIDCWYLPNYENLCGFSIWCVIC